LLHRFVQYRNLSNQLIYYWLGGVKQKVLSFPLADSTQIRTPCCSTIFFTMVNPTPVPSRIGVLTIAMKCRYGIDTRILPFELAKLKDLVITIDPKAFLIINQMQEGIGKGFYSPGGFAVNKV